MAWSLALGPRLDRFGGGRGTGTGAPPPASVYHPSDRSYPGLIQEPEFPVGTTVARERTSCEIEWKAKKVLLTQALIREPPALRQKADRKESIHVGSLEFGLLDGEPIMIDEMLTPDSSRFWEAKEHNAGVHQEAYDKQYFRDWLSKSVLNRQPPAPELPPDVVP